MNKQIQEQNKPISVKILFKIIRKKRCAWGREREAVNLKIRSKKQIFKFAKLGNKTLKGNIKYC